jgi:SHS2 domain-containing protein
MLPGYEVLQHPTDIELKLHARTWPELLSEAGRALSARLWAGTPWETRGNGAWHRVELHASDRAALLVKWINELLYEAEAGWWVPVEFEIQEASSHYVRARVRYVTVDAPPPALNATAPAGVHVTQERAGLEATVVLA